MKPWLRTTLLIIFAAVFLVSGYFLVQYMVQSRQSQDKYNDLADMVQNAKPTEPPAPSDGPGEPDVTEPPSPWVEVTDPETGETVLVLPEYAELYEMNNDVVGWLAIEGTQLNYPVMQTPDSRDYYLHRDFYREYDRHGCIYVREECDVNKPSDNLTIYGHNMKDGTMFGALLKYEKQSFWQEHQYITFDTLTEHHTYQIIAVFQTTASVGEGFSYHNFIDGDENAFREFVSTCKALSLYDTGVSAQYGDKLITLSTCEYTLDNGRLVVCAVRIT